LAVCHLGEKPEKESDRGQRRLHRVAALIGGNPFLEQRSILEAEPCGLLGEADVQRGAVKIAAVMRASCPMNMASVSVLESRSAAAEAVSG
jgi:hypothetical protein